MSWIESEKKSLNYYIKSITNGLYGQFALLIFNIIGILFNIYFLKNFNLSWSNILSSGIGIGAFLSNGLWTLAFILIFIGNIRESKRKLRYIDELELQENIEDDIRIYKEAAENYNAMAETYKKALDELQQNKQPGAHGSSPTGRVNFSMEQPTSL